MPIELGSLSIGAVVGGIIVGLANHFLSKSRSKEAGKIAAFNNAAPDFRNAFLPEMTFLKHDANVGGLGGSNKLHGILRTGYLRQLKALEVFKRCLSPAEISTIDRAWDEYCHPNNIPTDPNEKRDFKFNDYMEIEDSEGVDKAKEVALQNINKILDIADFK